MFQARICLSFIGLPYLFGDDTLFQVHAYAKIQMMPKPIHLIVYFSLMEMVKNLTLAM